MQASTTPTTPNTPQPAPGLVLGIYHAANVTGLALRNPASRPQLTWAALLAPTGDEATDDYLDRVTAFIVSVRRMQPDPTPTHLGGLRTGTISGTREPTLGYGRSTLHRAIQAVLDEPSTVVPFGDYQHLLGGRLPSPINTGWPDHFGPRQHHDLTVVTGAFVLTRWTPYLSPAPSLAEVAR